ncbi:hypothetical protein [Neobacillus sp. YIM B06451]|uniref:hypothetical protein n=1 Tax=Neobacillus sp. YIM B06451 TaxID=3070994 RepID=UPI002931907A|nr:hypothetical protein [Neobacillus sp. YIM B06451]
MSKKILARIVVIISLILLVCLILVKINQDEPVRTINRTSESKELTRLINEIKENFKDNKEISEIKLQNGRVVIATTLDSLDVNKAVTFANQITEKLTQLNQQDVVGISYNVEINDKAGKVISEIRIEN